MLFDWLCACSPILVVNTSSISMFSQKTCHIYLPYDLLLCFFFSRVVCQAKVAWPATILHWFRCAVGKILYCINTTDLCFVWLKLISFSKQQSTILTIHAFYSTATMCLMAPSCADVIKLEELAIEISL